VKWGIGPLGERHLGPEKFEIQDFKPKKILGIEEKKLEQGFYSCVFI
jgi:hypothetical protein